MFEPLKSSVMELSGMDTSQKLIVDNHIFDGTPCEFERLMHGVDQGKIWSLLQKITYWYKEEHRK